MSYLISYTYTLYLPEEQTCDTTYMVFTLGELDEYLEDIHLWLDPGAGEVYTTPIITDQSYQDPRWENDLPYPYPGWENDLPF